MSMSHPRHDYYFGPPRTLGEALALKQATVLKRMLELISAPKPRPAARAGMIEVLERELAGPVLRDLWQILDESQKLAVQEAVHDEAGLVHAEVFRAKYGNLAGYFANTGSEHASPFTFFFYPKDRWSSRASFIPPDLRERLRGFVPPPPEATVAFAEEPPDSVPRGKPSGEKRDEDRQAVLLRRDMEPVGIHDLLAVLRLVDQGKVAVSTATRRPSSASMLRIAEALQGGDFFNAAQKKPHSSSQVPGPIRSFAWPLLLQAGGLVELGRYKLALSEAGRKALREPAEKTLPKIWKKWLRTTLLDEFNRVEAIKGQARGKGKRSLTATPGRRRVISNALTKCPVGKWLHIDEFLRFMRAQGLHFEVSRSPWHLYIADRQYGSLGHEGDDDWNVLQGRYARCLLFEYSATLGMIDIAFTHPDGAKHDFYCIWGTDGLTYLSRYDGLEYFRINPLGAHCLGMSAKYVPSQPRSVTTLSVYPDMRVCARHPLSAEERFFIELWANQISDGVWRIDREKTLLALESGHRVEQLRGFLAERDDQPLPEQVEGYLRNVERDAGALTLMGSALLLECASAEIAQRIAEDRRAGKLCSMAGDQSVLVNEAKWSAFQRAVREMGLGIKAQ